MAPGAQELVLQREAEEAPSTEGQEWGQMLREGKQGPTHLARAWGHVL